MPDPHATGSRVCPCGWAGDYAYIGSMSGKKECPRCGRYESEARNATPDRAAKLDYPTIFAAVLNAINCSGYRVEGPNSDTDVNASDLADCITIELLTPQWKP